ncbi:MAG: DUF4190 domain-containing protein [Candidatus Omnitrophota bacterium]
MSEENKKTVGFGIASLVLGCLILIPILGMLFALLAIIFGIVALVQISGHKETLKGKGLATSGIVLGGIGLVLLPIVAIMLAIAIPAFMRAKERAREQAVTQEYTSSISIEERGGL